MLAEALALHGHQVALAHDPASALRVAAEHRPDVALLDVRLPQAADGYELAAELKRQYGERMILIAMSGMSTPEAIERGRAAGFDHYLIKPIDLTTLLRLISTGLKMS